MGKQNPPKKDNPKYIKQQLKGKRCNHDHKHKETNRNGKEFWQCDQCPAFLGWV